MYLSFREQLNELYNYLYIHHRDYILNVFRFDDAINSLPYDKQDLVLDYINTLSGDELVMNIEWILANVRIIYYDMKPKVKTVTNLISWNKKVINRYLAFVSRPLESQIPYGEEQMFEPFTNMADNVSDMTTEISATCMGMRNTIFPATLSTMRNLNTLVDPLSETIGNINDTVIKANDTLTNIEKMFDVPEDSLYKNLIKHKVGIMAQLYNISQTKNFSEMTMHVLPMLSMLGLESKVFDQIKNRFSQRLAQEQSFGATKEMFGLLLTMFGNMSPDNILKRFTTATKKSMVEIEALDKLVNMICDVLAEFGFDITSKAKTIRALQEDLKSVMDKMVEFDTIALTNACKFCDERFYRDFMICYEKVINMKKIVDTGSYSTIRTSNFCQDLMRIHLRFTQLRKIAEEVRGTSGRRAEPMAFLFLGPRKLGKSELLLDFPKLVYKYYKKHYKNDPEYEFMEMMKDGPIWSQNPQDEYHQGYHNHLWHVNDDLFSKADHSDHQDWLNFISPVCFLTKQAELSDKGKPYQALGVVGSANNFPKSSKVILNVEALQRRFTIIHTSLKPGCNVPEKGTQKHSLTYDWLDFKLQDGFDYGTDNNGGESINLEGIIKYYLNGLRLRQREYEEALNSTDDDDEEELEYTREKVYFDSVFCEEIKTLFRVDRRLYLKMCNYHVKHDVFADTTEGTGRFRELIGHNSNVNFFSDSYNLLSILCREIKRTNVKLADVIFVARMDNGTVVDFDMATGNIKLNFNREDRADGQDYQDEQFYMRWYRKIRDYYYNSNNLFRVVVDVIAQMSNCIGYAFGSTYYSILVVVSSLHNLASVFIDHEPEWFQNVRLLIRGASLAPLIPMIAVGIGLVVYKCFSFQASEVCAACKEKCDSDNMYDELVHICYGSKDNANNLWPVVCAVQAETCQACILGVCDKKCLHINSLNNYDREFIRLARDFIEWYNGPVEESNKFYGREEVSPTGLKQKKNKRVLGNNEFCPYDECIYQFAKGYCNNKTCTFKHTLKEEVSPNGLKQKRNRRHLQESAVYEEEVSPNGLKQKKNRRCLQEAEIICREEFNADVLALSEEYDFNTTSPGSKQKKKLEVFFMDSGKEQMTNDLSARQLFVKISKMSVQCYAVNGDLKTGALFGHPFGLNGRNYIVTPAHLVPRNKHTMKFYTIVNEKHLEMKLVGYKRERDVAVWTVEPGQNFSRTFYDQLLNEDEIIQMTNRPQNALQHLPTTNILQFVECEPVLQQTINLNNQFNQTYDSLFKITGLKSSAPLTIAGDCGGIIILYNTKFIRKVLGFHVVGAHDCAYSAILTRELIDKLIVPTAREEIFLGREVYDLKSTKYPVVDIMNTVIGEVEEPFISTNLPQGDFEYIGEFKTLTKPAGETQLHPHPFKDIPYKNGKLFEENMAPAILNIKNLSPDLINTLEKDNEGRPSILVSQTKKYGKIFHNVIEPKILLNMKEQLAEYYEQVFNGMDLGISTDYEILNGDIYDDASHPLDMRTSAGVPWNTEAFGMGRKKEYYTNRTTYTNTHGNLIEARVFNDKAEHLLKVVAEKERLAAKGYRTLSLVKTCLKDEVRPLEKRHKPRVFMAFPFESVILHRKYFLKFKTEFTKNARKLFHAVGIDVTSPRWAELYNDLREKSSVGGDADFGKFDGNLRPEFMEMACDVIISTIRKNNPEVDELTMHVLLDEVIRTTTIAGKTIYIDTHGNPSGCVLTTIINCIVNMLYHWYCFIKITGYEGLDRFIDNVCIRCFGDDVVYSAKPGSDFTFEKISKIMNDILEQDYTDAAKGLDGHSKRVEELTFLKRSFKPISASIVLAPLCRDSLEQQFLYTMIEDNDFATHFQCIRETLIEAAQH